MKTRGEIIQLAYADLVGEVFLRLRNNFFSSHDQLIDIGDALHNIGQILMGDHACLEDREYRRLYLQPYDSVWGSKWLALEAFLDARIEFHSRE